MIHKMDVIPSAYEMMRSGRKNYDLRLFDEERSKLQVGDTICFSNSENPEENLSARVQQLLISKNFKELYKKLPLLSCGYTEDNVAQAKPEDMEKFYSSDEQKYWGVVAIRYELLN